MAGILAKHRHAKHRERSLCNRPRLQLGPNAKLTQNRLRQMCREGRGVEQSEQAIRQVLGLLRCSDARRDVSLAGMGPVAAWRSLDRRAHVPQSIDDKDAVLERTSTALISADRLSWPARMMQTGPFQQLFTVGDAYSRAHIHDILGVPRHQRYGNWTTGYHCHAGSWFVFVNIGLPGRTGHDYDNAWEDRILRWRGKTGSRLDHQSIRDMIDASSEALIFTRVAERAPFTFEGRGRCVEVLDTQPVTVCWAFDT